MGARPMARTIQEKLEDMLARKLLSGELNKGDSITVSAKEIN
jgi:ATP-dependent Clp protease ATP-binding subunit ClpA